MPKIYSNPFFNSNFMVRPKVYKRRTFIKNHYFCMRVHLIRRASLEEYGLRHPLSRNALQELTVKLKYANWNIPLDITATFPDADILGKGSSRVIFNINGNRYRLICKYTFGLKQVHLFVCWIGTHAEYDKICSVGNQYNINIY